MTSATELNAYYELIEHLVNEAGQVSVLIRNEFDYFQLIRFN